MDPAQTWHDDFIFANWEKHRNWLSLNHKYNNVYGTNIGYNTFKSHCYRLGLNFHYSEEQQAWLTDTYPDHGYIETAKMFNEKFKTNRSAGAIKTQCKKMGLKVKDHRRAARANENTKKYIYPIGSIVAKSHGEPYIKTDNGWRRLKNVAYGSVPKGKILVHLNGNVEDCRPDNLYAISRNVNARMTLNNFWSENSTITKTGIMCCELEQALHE